MPDQNAINGFAGNVAVLTTWGACRLHDLARLTESRDAAEQQWQSRFAELGAHCEAELADFDERVAPTLSEADAAALREAMLAVHAAQVNALQAKHDAAMELRLPEIVIDNETTAECLGVVQVGVSASVVDVTIAQTPIGDPPQNLPTVVRCGTAAVFITSIDDVAAADIDGETLNLHPTDTFVATASGAVLNEPIKLYQVLSASGVCCVGADSMVAVRVRCTAP